MNDQINTNVASEEQISQEANKQIKISEEEYKYSQEVIKKLSDYYDAKVVGQQQLKFSLIGAIIADGHILIESVPGLAKTTAAKAISDAVDGKFARIQCTPDLLPGDIIGKVPRHSQLCWKQCRKNRLQ